MVATRHFQRIISADSHVMEPLDLWWNALGQTFGDRTPRVLDEYQGHAYLSLRVWHLGDDRGWWPTKKWCSIRLREAGALAAALAELVAERDDPDDRSF